MTARSVTSRSGVSNARLGSVEQVLWERPRPGLGGLAHGLTDTYIRVVCPTSRELRNRFAPARMIEIADGCVRGEIVDEGVRGEHADRSIPSDATPKGPIPCT